MHRLLVRQIKKELGDEFLEDENFKSFFLKISEYYEEKDKERQLLENALDVSTKELNELNRKNQEKNEALLRIQESALDAAANMIMITNRVGKIIYVNRSFCDFTGFSKEELIGASPQIISSNTHPSEFYRNIWEMVLSGKTWVGEIVNMRKDGSLYPEEMTVTPIYESGEITHFVAIKKDITERKLAEDELRLARDQALEASRLKSEFLATMSHEIRTPMNGVVGMIDILLDSKLTELQREYLCVIKDSSGLLLTIINDILDFSKIEAGKLDIDYSEVNVVGIVEGICEILYSKAKENNNALISYVDPRVNKLLKGDPTRITQVITNLVGNAIKFTKNGEVSVKVFPIMYTDNFWKLRFEISDTGIGISKENQTKLFQSFVQADGSTTRQYGGTGLGLAISKRLVELMGGQIWLESEEGKGSTFSFTIPFEEVQPDISEITNIDFDKFKDLRVLIVDDSPNSRDILSKYLKYWTIECVTADSGKEALNILKSSANSGKKIDIAIIDLMMPDMDGFELAAKIKIEESMASTKMILWTAYDQKGTAHQAKGCGFLSYITKPIKQNALLEALYNVLIDDKQKINIKQEEKDCQKENVVLAKSKGHILVAEDNKTNQKVATLLLNKMGYTVEIADNGQIAVEMTKTKPYDLILMDFNMPVMDGLEATRQIRQIADEQISGINIIALTANAADTDRDICLNAGMNDYISKPINQKELEEKVNFWCAKH